MRIAVVATSLCLSIAGLASASDVQAMVRYATHISPQPLGSALRALAKDRGFHLVYLAALVNSANTRGADGALTQDEALTQLLSGTGLVFHYLDPDTVTIVPAARVEAQTGEINSAALSADSAKEAQEEGKKSSSGGFRLAQVGSGASSSAHTLVPDALSQSVVLEEVVVTAQKRAERLQDVPVPVTAISADSLVDSGQMRLQDYYSRIPGLSVTTGGFHALQLTIRGLTTGGGNPTVGVVIDDVPYGPTKGTAFGLEAPDLDPSELQRVEVLRGPQGTLYGAGSMGGLLKYVTVDPSTDALSGGVQAGGSSVRNGAEAGYNARASVNVPLGDNFAVRASGYVRQDPGYIDNPVLGIDGVNETVVSGGRLSALWRPSTAFTVKLSALVQQSNLHGSPEVDIQPGLGDLQQNDVRGSGVYKKTIQAYSGTVSGKFGNVDLTSLTGYNVSRFTDVTDFSAAFPPASVILESAKTAKFSQELRLSVPLGTRLEWLIGGFYTHENTDPTAQDLFAANRQTGALGAQIVHTNQPNSFDEYAGFTDLTVRLTERFDVQLGARESKNSQDWTSLNVLAGQTTAPVIHTSDDAFTYLVTPRFKLSPDLMIYARLASGYRPGGPNTNVALFGLPNAEYQPDKTQNYEIGVKGAALERLVSFDASLYRIDWKDIQIQVKQNGFSYYINGGEARSEGAELAVETRPARGLTISAWGAWNKAVLTEPFSPTATVHGVSGDRLPFSSRFTGNLAIDQEFPLSGQITGVVGASLAYTGDRKSVFRGLSAGIPLPRQDFPAYAKTDLRAGVRYRTWATDFFVNNAANRRGVLQGGLGATNPAAFYYIEPLTIGVLVSKTFSN